MKKLFTTIVTTTIILHTFAQQREGLNYGFRVGALFASNKTAQYYNGSGLGSDIMRMITTPNTDYYNQISEYFNDDFSLYSYAAMRYKPALQLGATLQYFFSPKFACITNLNIAKLRSEGVMQFALASPPQTPQPGNQNVRNASMTSTENRFGWELGVHYTKAIENSPISPYIDGGALLSVLSATSATLEVGNSSYTLYRQSQGNTETNHNYFGYGAFVSVGAQYYFAEKATLMLGFDVRAVNFSSLPPKSAVLQNSITVSVLF
ncbi:MAG: hypothetical protein LBU90_06930 [Bacteroidales bacterium]|jgi:hypothetical protein|nr:hypothetical protein [Bacteroidales bacterium]